MDTITTFAIIGLSGLIHASFQLSVSTLTLLSGHTISREKSHLKLVKLAFALVFGATFSTIMLFCFFAFFSQIFYSYKTSRIIWTIICGLLAGTGISVWIFYYKRKSTSTELWLPREFSRFLKKRTSKTKHSAEAFSLGLTSVISEIIFIFAPISAAAFATTTLVPSFQFLAVVLYSSLASLPIFSVACMISGGQPISEIQIWRENNKKFIQFVASIGLIILAIFIYSTIYANELSRLKL